MQVFEADLISTIRSFTRAGDISEESFLDHAERVAHIAYHLGKKLALEEAELAELVLSALLHDVGILTTEEKLVLADREPVRDRVSPTAAGDGSSLGPSACLAPGRKRTGTP